VITLSEKGVPKGITDRTIVLGVDIIAFRPRTTRTEDGEVSWFQNLKHLDEDLFTHFLKDPNAFAQFIHQH
jgi:hypothetical protein